MTFRAEITFEITTPAYAGGSDVMESDGLRPPTLKALLRFWWRTMHADIQPQDLYAREAAIFGSTNTGQGIRIIPVNSRVLRTEKITPYRPNQLSPLFYMAYGAQDRDNQPRPRIVCGQSVTYKIVSGRHCTQEQWSEVTSAIWLLGTFGGVGSRSRRGFGSLSLISVLDDTDAESGEKDTLLAAGCQSRADVCQRISASLSSVVSTAARPDFSAFSKLTRVVVGKPARTWESALIDAGSVYYELRRALGTTYNHGPRNAPVGMDFRRICYYGRIPPNNAINKATLGSAFGLPHNYQFSSPPGGRGYGRRWSPSIQVEIDDKEARRASPVFFHVAKIATGEYVPIVLWLRSRFLPEDEDVNLHFKDGKPHSVSPVDDSIIGCLFDRGPTNLRNWINDVEQTPIRFTGYLGRPGWQEVKL